MWVDGIKGISQIFSVVFFVNQNKMLNFARMKQYVKMIGGVVLTVSMALALANCASQQEKAERRMKMRQTVEEAVAKRQLHIGIISMNTLRYGARTVTSDFFLELRGDTLRSYLPYLGQAHQAPFTSPSIGLNFEAPILHYIESQPKSNLYRLEMNVKTEEDTYYYMVELFDTGEAFINVRSQNRDPISFSGAME